MVGLNQTGAESYSLLEYILVYFIMNGRPHQDGAKQARDPVQKPAWTSVVKTFVYAIYSCNL